MEEIKKTFIDYQFKDFIKINDTELIDTYLFILEHLNPLDEIVNPNYKWWNKELYKLKIQPIIELSFEQVTNIRNNFNEASIQGIIDSIAIITGLKNNNIERFKISVFYGIINSIKEQLEQITNIEINELTDDEEDIDLLSVNASERMAKFGAINTIDSLANNDVLKWSEIEKLPYLTVFTKLKMDREKARINKEIMELQKKRIKN